MSAAIGPVCRVPPIRGGSVQPSLSTIWNNALPCCPAAERGTGRDRRDKQELAPPYLINPALYWASTNSPEAMMNRSSGYVAAHRAPSGGSRPWG